VITGGNEASCHRAWKATAERVQATGERACDRVEVLPPPVRHLYLLSFTRPAGQRCERMNSTAVCSASRSSRATSLSMVA
jgi:hypothetical protein